MISLIANREFKTLFLSPLAWTVLAILQALLAFLFLKQVETFSSLQPQLAALENGPSLTDVVINPLYSNAGIIFLLITPLFTMRLICLQRQNKTLTLLLSAPIHTRDIILGNFLACYGLLLLVIAITSLMPLSLLLGGSIDCGKLIANFMALSLLAAAFTAIGLYFSCLTQHPTLAAVATFGALFLLWIIDWSTGYDDNPKPLLAYLSILRHFQNLQSGLISSADLLYFLLLIATFLMLAIQRLNKDRLL